MNGLMMHFYDLAGGVIQQKSWNIIAQEQSDPSQWPATAGNPMTLLTPSKDKKIVICGLYIVQRNIIGAGNIFSGILLRFGATTTQTKMIGYYLPTTVDITTAQIIYPMIINPTTPYVGLRNEIVQGVHYNPSNPTLDTGLQIQYMEV